MATTYADLQFAEPDERRALEQMVEVQRTEIARLLDRVTEDEARERLVPSLTTVLGLVKHAVFVEQVWFHHRVAGRSRAAIGLPDDIDTSFQLTPDDTIASVRAAFESACAESRRIAGEHTMEETLPWRLGPISLRFMHLHLIAEYARHAGHGDVLVEQLVARRG